MMTSGGWDDLVRTAEEGGLAFELVPDNEYEFYIKKATARKTQDGKKDMIAAMCAIIGGPQDGKTVYNQFVISPENPLALGFFFRHMTVLGADKNWFSAHPAPNAGGLAMLADFILGSRFRATVTTKSVNKEMRNNLDKIMPSAVAPGQKFGGAATPPPGLAPQPGLSQPPPAPAPAPTPSSAPTVPPVPAPAVAQGQSTDEMPAAPKPPF